MKNPELSTFAFTRLSRFHVGPSAALVLGFLSACKPQGGPSEGSPAEQKSAANERQDMNDSNPPPSIHSLVMKRLNGQETALSVWSGKVLLVVNTASECGFTPQYEGLQALHQKYQGKGFEVLGFPSNDFGGQEPGSSEEIAKFCSSKFNVTFPMFEKVKTTGPNRAPLYKLLAESKGEPKWNFHKYLVNKQGQPVEAWASRVDPGSPEILNAIERELAK